MSRGRNRELIEKRNEKLAQRWYFWTEQQRLRFDDALKILSQQEFFLSEDRVMTILREYIKEHPQTKMSTHIKIKAPKLTAEQLSLFTDQ
ncbi:MAG: transposase, partial [Candidatus Cryptobacteroides sp.]